MIHVLESDCNVLSVFILSYRFSCTMTYYGLTLNVRDISDSIALNVFIMGTVELFFNTSVIFMAKWYVYRSLHTTY